MTEFVISADGTRIAYDTVGSGPAVILVGGANQFRAFDTGSTEVARLLAESGFTAVTYDRRGRGESGDTLPYVVDREVDDIEALSRVVGGNTALYGSSSGAVLCLWAAARLPGIQRVTSFGSPRSIWRATVPENLSGLQTRLAAGDREATVAFFMRDMPPQWLDGARNSPAWPTLLSVAHTLAYDAAVLARAEQGDLAEHWTQVTIPVIVLIGEETQPIFPPAADAIVAALPNATQRRIDARHHSYEPAVIAREISDFLTQ